HQGFDIVEPTLDMAQVGQDQIDPWLVMTGEQHAAVDDQQPAQMLENGHVAADFADSAERGDADCAGRQWPRWCQWLAHRSTAAARISAARASICESVAGICGNRGSPTSMPCNRSPS